MLDDQTMIEKIDKDGMLAKIQEQPDQVKIAWEQVQNFIIPTHYINAKNVVVLGMGGSAIGGDLIRDLVKSSAKIPVHVVRDYDLPKFVDSTSLVIASTYSGETEETITAFTEAIDRGAKTLIISTGGKAAALSRKYKIPMFEIKYQAQPRAAIAYSLIPLLGIFNKLGYIELGINEVLNAVTDLINFKQKNDINVPTSQNDAKKLAEKLHNRLPVVIGGGILSNVARRFKDQINENAKQVACFDEIPELCHNHIVGLDKPENILKETYTILLQSRFDNKRNNLRNQILIQLFQKKGIKCESIMLDCKGGKIAEILHNVLFADYVSYYLAILNQVDPTPVETIKFLKDRLAENK